MQIGGELEDSELLSLDRTLAGGPVPAYLRGSQSTLPGDVGATLSDVDREPAEDDLHIGGLQRGASIGRFVMLELLGSGGMGEVFLCYDPELDRRVAVKLLRPVRGGPAGEAPARLIREARAIARLTHPNVVTVHDVAMWEGRVFLAMEYVAGPTLTLWARERASDGAPIVAVYRPAGEGLAAAHRAGLVHRDFKPKSRRPSQTAPQPTDRPHSHSQGRFERVDVYRAAPGRSGVPQVLAKRWQRAGPLEDQRGHAPRHSQGRHHEPFPSHPFATAAPRAAAGR